MQALDEEMETIHLYVVRGEEKRPYTAFPLFCAFLCLIAIVAVTLYSAQNPYYERKQVIVPATFLPLKVFRAEAPIIPTGVKTYPATYARGTLTLTNGSVLSEVLPEGVIFNGVNGIEVQTTQSVSIPAGSASGYGVATVPAKAVQGGSISNIQALAINAVYGTALYIRNMTSFSGGNDSYTEPLQLPKDRQAALNTARMLVAAQKAQVLAFLAKPCKETTLLSKTLIRLSWRCQFAVYRVPSYMRVLGAKLAGKDFLVTVEFIPPPQRIWAK